MDLLISDFKEHRLAFKKPGKPFLGKPTAVRFATCFSQPGGLSRLQGVPRL